MGSFSAEPVKGSATAFLLDNLNPITRKAGAPDSGLSFVDGNGRLMKTMADGIQRHVAMKAHANSMAPTAPKRKIPYKGTVSNHSRKNEDSGSSETSEQPFSSELPMVGKLEKSQINIDEILKIAKVMLDKDSPHGENGAAWASGDLADKINWLDERYGRSLLKNGVETATSIALRRQIDFLSTVKLVIHNHLEKMKPAQEQAGELFRAVAEKWGKKMKIPDFIDSVIAKYVAPGMGVLGGAAAKLTNIWDGFMDTLKSALSPQKQWIVDGAKVAVPIIAGIADLGAVYFARKGLISWAANKKEKMEEKKQAELQLIENGRQLMLKSEYGEAEREILALLSQPSTSC